MDFSIAPIFSTYIKFLDLLFFNLLKLDKFIIILLALPLSFITLFLSTLNVFKANFLNNLVVFNYKINNIAIFLKF